MWRPRISLNSATVDGPTACLRTDNDTLEMSWALNQSCVPTTTCYLREILFLNIVFIPLLSSSACWNSTPQLQRLNGVTTMRASAFLKMFVSAFGLNDNSSPERFDSIIYGSKLNRTAFKHGVDISSHTWICAFTAGRVQIFLFCTECYYLINWS